MVLRLYNTLTRQKEEFHPLDPERVRMYVCGPTVYQRIHLGNARAFVVFDVLYRLLRHLYGEEHVIYARNITDIDDKIMDAVAKSGEDIRDLTDRTTLQFQDDLKALGCLPPTFEPRATDHVGDMIRLIQDLIERGHAYVAEGHVLFNVPSWPDYGRLSGRNRDEQIAGARVDVAPYKRDPADFVLWKPSADTQAGWDSPWGRGRPGWHIECSAMSERLLGVPFDIHAGGLDLIFPHHENEIAQTCCAHGIETMARYWLHNGFLDMRGEKMSKSVGNVVRVPEALGAIGTERAEAVRYSLLSTHYRQPANYTKEGAQEAKLLLDSFYGTLARSGMQSALTDQDSPDPAIIDALSDDLNTAEALSVLHQLSGEANKARTERAKKSVASRLRGSGCLLGILQADPAGGWLKQTINVVGVPSMTAVGTPATTIFLPEHVIEQAIDERKAARLTKNFRQADEIRARLASDGVILEDRADGTTDWRRS